jgi:Protein of unknown function (DUF3152)
VARAGTPAKVESRTDRRRRQVAGRRRRGTLAAAAAALAGIVLVIGTSPSAGVQRWLVGLGIRAPSTPAAPASSPRASAPPPATATTAVPRPAVTTTPSRSAATIDPASIPHRGSGRLVPVPGRVAPAGTGRPFLYQLVIEGGLPFEPAETARVVQHVLVDPRGWQPIEHVAFGRTDGADYDIRIILASPATTDALCAPLDTIGELSCRNGNHVVFNAVRWATAVPWYADRLDDYRAYLVNHEVGHALGHHHRYCPGAGRPAPVMMQQTKGLGGCRANPWPAVTGG